MAYEVVADSILPPDHVGDVVTEMGVALLRAARTYTDDHGAVFLTYLHQVALRAGQDYVRRETHILLTLGRSLDDFPSDEERDAYLCHSACQHKDCRTCRQSHDPLEAFIVSGLYDSLSESQRVALQVIAAGGSERDIARAVGCSLEAARKLRQRLLKLLRDR